MTVEVYPLAIYTVLSERDERHFRERDILSLADASTRLGRKLRPFLAALEQRLAS